jgi:hypothetical protein
MHHVPLTIDKNTAREAWRSYLKAKHYSTPIDEEIARCYKMLAQGKLVIKALESIRTAGCDDNGLPKLAIARADAKEVHLQMWSEGSATMSSVTGRGRQRLLGRAFNNHFTFESGTFGRRDRWRNADALVPIVPINERPKRALQNFHVLFEAEWRKAVPIDPFLLKRLGKSDMWVVCAMWDLSEIERTALAARL